VTEAIYEQIGRKYRSTRHADPRISKEIRQALGDAESIVNIGAGVGSYEPTDLRVVPVEPSQTMIRQRPASLASAMPGFAEALPLPSRSVDAALAVLTVHHWSDRPRAFAEIRRVARKRAVFFTHDPSAGFAWLDDYFPAFRTESARRYPGLREFDSLGGRVESTPVLIPADCTDGFTGAYWRRPDLYLDPNSRANMSTFALLKADAVEEGVQALERDLSNQTWHRRYGDLLELSELDVGYRIVRAEFA
jgi:SAM-dependent methyltransferase